ncbi:M28 family metallopeptidase [Caulobacter sp. 17J65-9]|uniref:M28 family metallopeptidase n=1 Tax=Caulobacter sp. 17J65-9 TaxID=2709382 RepID=UPI0013C568F8|nr:M28 family metallopeptidase [Caulobacter sp. 17J65-9]NEX93176.1 M28 family peptidase [Caulobacter sp. 17J65-9]
MKRLALAALLLALAAPPAFAADTPVDPAAISAHVKILADDSFEGRGVGTEGEKKTIAYVSQQFARAGFQPGGPDGAWVQPVTLRRFEVSNPTARLQVGGWSQALTQGEQIVMSTRRPAQRVDIRNAPLVFVGYGVSAPERGWDDYKGQDLKGKIAVVLVNDADFEDPALNTFGGKAMTYYGRWTYKYEEAARRGAEGVLIVHETRPASYGWNTVKNSWSGPQFDIVRKDPDKERIPLEAWLQRDTAVELFKRAGLDFEAEKYRARSRDFRPVVLKDASLSAAFDVATSTIQSNNVIGLLPGAKRPGEYVLYTAHWDHLGVGAPDANGDAIFNGAVDNATGTAALIELARLFASGPRPERSIVLIAFTAEESGLLGSEYYASNPVYPLAMTVAGFNMDALNVAGRTRDIGVVGSGETDLEDDLARVAKTQNRVVVPDSTPEAGGFFRSDHFPLAKRGVPMLYAGGGDDFIDDPAKSKAMVDDYGRNRYHQADDEWSPDWDLRGAAEDVSLLYLIGLDLANSPRWPQWRADAAFKAARDATAAERR